MHNALAMVMIVVVGLLGSLGGLPLAARAHVQQQQPHVTVQAVSPLPYLKASNTEADDYFGWSVAISGDTMVVGTRYEDSSATGGPADNSAINAGAVYVFVRSGSTWSQQAMLKASNAEAVDWFGYSVAISSDTIVVGAPLEASSVMGGPNDNSTKDAGAAYVFTRTGTAWSEQTMLKATNAGAGDWFGEGVAISGDTIVVGAPYEDSSTTGGLGDNSATDAGAAYVFGRSGTAWNQQTILKASNADAGDAFGQSVAISGESIVVGAPGEASSATGGPSDNSAPDAGAAYVFARSGTTWSQQAMLKASNAEAKDWFGQSVAISGENIVVGAPPEDSSTTGGPSDNSATDAGAAYLCTRSGTTWSQQAMLKANNAGTDDRFGSSVAISGDTVMVSAPYEDSSATGGPSDNSASGAGAAYPFSIAAATPLRYVYLPLTQRN